MSEHDAAAVHGAPARSVTPYLWMLFGAFVFSMMTTLAHHVRDRFAWQIIALARSIIPFSLMTLSAWWFGGRLVLFGPGALWLRSIAGSTSLVCAFFTFTRMPVSDALTLTNLFPIWVALLSWPMLRQRPGGAVWICVAFAVGGVAFIQQPHLAEGKFASMLATFSSVASALAMIGLHRVQSIDTRAIVWHFSAISMLFAGTAYCTLDRSIPVAARTPSLVSWLCLVGVGTAATIGQYCLTKAFTLGIPSRVSVVGLSQVGFVMVFEVLLEGRNYNAATLVGMFLVLAPTAWLLLRHHGADAPDTRSMSEAG